MTLSEIVNKFKEMGVLFDNKLRPCREHFLGSVCNKKFYTA